MTRSSPHTPAGNWTTVRGRSPGSRVVAFVRLPEASRPQWRIGRTLAGYSCGGSREFQSRSLFIPADENVRRKPRTPKSARSIYQLTPAIGPQYLVLTSGAYPNR